ncbi:MAG: LemA family protein [Salinivenus sp.]
MWTLLIVLGVLLLPVLLVGGYAISQYNTLVQLENRYENAYSQIDVQLKRRYDLIPNLVETVKGYLDHERETLEAVTQARNQAMQANEKASSQPGNPEAMEQLNAAESMLSSSLGRLMVVAEDYPDLKANESVGQLMEELRSTENKISFARQSFNDAVTRYNTARESFPTNLIANAFNYNQAELFEIDTAEERQAPDVSFS